MRHGYTGAFVIAFLFLVLTGCGLQLESSSVGNHPPAQGNQVAHDRLEEPPVEKEITLGIAGYEQEVIMQRFSNDWITLWVDTALEQVIADRRLQFLSLENDIAFTIERIGLESRRAKEEIIAEFVTKGYELMNQFSLEHLPGEGYIYYCFDEKKSLDIYLLEHNKEWVMVTFHLPDEYVEEYILRFEYMLDSIDLSLPSNT